MAQRASQSGASRQLALQDDQDGAGGVIDGKVEEEDGEDSTEREEEDTDESSDDAERTPQHLQIVDLDHLEATATGAGLSFCQFFCRLHCHSRLLLALSSQVRPLLVALLWPE